MGDDERRAEDTSPGEPGFRDAARPTAPPPRRGGGLKGNPMIAWVVGIVVLAVLALVLILALS